VRVTDSSGAPVVGTEVQIYEPKRTVATSVTNGAGRVAFDSLPFGVYGVVVSRPELYRSFRATNDSLYKYRDGFIVDEGWKDSAFVVLARCAGTVRATVTDDAGAPVPGVRARLYTVAGVLQTLTTASNGQAVFPNAECATQMGVRIESTFTHVAAEGRGTSFADGVFLTNGAVADLQLRVQRCSGLVRVLVRDQTGAPVNAAGLLLYASTGPLTPTTTGSDGRALIPAPCGMQLGVRVQPPAGYSVVEGRGTSFVDGFTMTNGAAMDITFTLQRP
jgi:hypothetical protein